LFALLTGSVDISASDLADWLSGPATTTTSTMILDLRLPRALSALVVGALLASAGTLMQVLLRNPLADPYIMGVSGGAAVATLLAMLFGLSGIWLSGSAFAGALLSILLVFLIAHGQGSWTPTRLLLTGVILAFGWAAMISFILAVSPGTQLHSMLYWLMGDLSASQMPKGGAIALLLAILVCVPRLRVLNVLMLGDDQAATLGIDVRKERLLIFIIASLMTAVAVTMAGSIGFVGLVVPHMLRLLAGSDHRYLFPASLLAGGSLLVIADTLARSVLAPQQLPVGVLTAMLGVPLFLFLLYKNRPL
jgi:iron complex transport system permease protein